MAVTNKLYLNFSILFSIILIFNFSLSGQNSLEVHISNNQVLKKKSNPFNYFNYNGDHDSLIVEMEDSILITILPKGKSSLLNFQDYGFRLRNIDKIKKIKVSISGYVNKDVVIKDKIIALSSGSHILSENMANKNMKGKRWPVDKNAKDWVYYFDLDQEKYDSISSTQFGTSILLENTSVDTADVVIQDVKIDVEYYSLISVCKDEIFTLYVDPPDEGYNYHWELPAGAYITSLDPNDYIINAVFTNNDFGIKEIKISAEKSGNILHGYGNLLYNDCRVSTLNGNIWLDNNCNDVLDTLDSGVDMFNLGLYSDDNAYLNKTDSLGNFHFDSIISDYYNFKINTGNNFSLVNSSKSSFILDDDENYNTEIFIKPGINIDSFNFGLIQNTNLSGDVFEDMNANLVKDSFDTNSLPNTKLVLSDSSGTIKSTFSDSLGKFNFNHLEPGLYNLCIEDTFESERFNDDCIEVDIECGEKEKYIDFGVFGYGEVTGIMWFDENHDGLRDSFENFIEGIRLELLDTSNSVIMFAISDSSGFYSFTDIIPGEYKIKLLSPGYFNTTLANIGSDSLDNDFISVDSFAYTDNLIVLSRNIIENVDCGFVYRKCSVGDFVWLDENKNNLQDSTESGVPGIEIQLLDKDSTIIESIISSEGDSQKDSYLFSDLEPGRYFIKAILPEKFSFVDAINADDKINSDINPETGLSNPIILGPGEDNRDIDIGLKYSFGEIESFVWLDKNYNGIQDSNEVAIPGIEMILIDADSSFEISRNISDSAGLVSFENILPEKYRLLLDSLDKRYKITNFENSMDQSLDCDFKTDGDEISSVVFEIYPGEIKKDIDLGLLYNFSTLSGFVWNDKDNNGIYDTGEKLLENIEIEIYDINESTEIPVSSTFTGVNGSYEFTGLESSFYFMKFKGNSRYKLGLGEGSDNYISNQNGLGTTDSIFIDWGQHIENINGALLSNKCLVGDLVWLDENGNGLKDSLELGVEGVHVDLYNTQDSLIQSTVSGEGGEYYIDGIEAGNYYLKFTCDSIYKFTIPKLNEDNGSKVIGTGFTGKTNEFLLEQGSQNLDLDAGLLVNYSSIGDFVWLDTNKNGTADDEEKGLDSIKLELVNIQSNLTRTAFTDEYGYYHFDSLEAGNYFLKLPDIDDTLDFAHTVGSKTDFTNLNGANTTSTFYLNPGTDYDDFDIGLVLKTGTLGDRVWLDANENGIQDSNENGLNNIQVFLFDITGIEYARTTTSQIEGKDGQYHFEVDPGYYFLRFILPYEYNSTIGKQGSEDLDSDISDAYGINTTELIYIQPGQTNNDIDAGLIYKKGSIGGWVWEDVNNNGIFEIDEPKIDGIKVYLYNKERIPIDSTKTLSVLDSQGYYKFEKIIPGDYYLVFDLPDKYIPTEPKIGTNNSIDSDVTGANGRGSTDIFMVLPDEKTSKYSAGLISESKRTISGRVWLDKDKNGIMDSLEPGINGVEVRLYKLNGVLKDKKFTKTDTVSGLDGVFQFTNISEDTYYIQFINQIGYFFTEPDVGNNDSLDSEVNSVIKFGATDTIFINDLVNLRNINAGFILDTHSSIGDRVWEDINGNGIQDDGEPGINGALVRLYKKGEGVVESFLTKTNEETGEAGYYRFDNLISGDYYVKINLPGNYFLTDPSKGDDTSIDSDITDENGINTSAYIHLGVNEVNNDIDIGAFHLGQVGDFVWLDENENGLQDPEESGKQNIFISVYNDLGEYLTTTISDKNGAYLSDLLKPGTYYIKILGYTPPSFTLSKAGDDDKMDSDITNENGDATSSFFKIKSGEINRDIDVGILPGSSTNLIIFPNPAVDKLQLTFNTSANEDVSIYINSISNEKIKEINITSEEGTNVLDIDLSDLNTGYYRIILEIDNEIIDTKTILKLK